MKWVMGSRVMDLTHSLKSSTLSFNPVCIGTNTQYLNQLAVKGANVTMSASGQSLNTTVTAIAAALKRRSTRAQLAAFLSSSS